MTTENVRALISYRLEQADESLHAAKVLLESELTRPSVNRAYYAMFYAVLALLASQEKETSKHSGAISLFDKDYVKTGIFTRDFSRWLHDAFDLRQRSDYAAKYSLSREEAEETLQNAISFVKEVKAKLAEQIDTAGK
ncbi:MAG: HEPN domain-containing protein [Deltaproteobacteria bacterium]|nr:HEPN domain-containing protein [Deltaproteobacteria bacterium]